MLDVGLADLSLFKDLPELESLDISHNFNEDISDISSLKNLKEICILGDDITDLSEFSTLHNLMVCYARTAVSGIFLITEDQMRVGETLVLDGFRGEVERIGLRTTTLKHYASVKVINNSKMVGFHNMSRDTNAVRRELSFPIEQDPEQVKALIIDNKERFQKACKGNIIAGPIYIGIAEGFTDYVGHAHYSMQFLFVTDMEEWNSVRKRSFDTAYKIMLENGIKPSGGEKKPLVK